MAGNATEIYDFNECFKFTENKKSPQSMAKENKSVPDIFPKQAVSRIANIGISVPIKKSSLKSDNLAFPARIEA